MKIVMIGAGYVGLVSGTCFADFGYTVVCVEKDKDKVESLFSGIMPIYEPSLDILVSTNIEQGRLSFSTDLAASVRDVDVVFIAVGTPSRRGDGHADLSHLYDAAKELAGALERDCVIVIKSTVPVGTGDEVERILSQYAPHRHHSLVSNPEFLREGAAIDDFKHPDRIIIGAEDSRGEAVLREIYRPLIDNESSILVTRRRTAEMIKYAANAFLATKITFINEIADLCEHVGADVQQVARGIGLDSRIGMQFLHAGPGYGGSCFPKDTLALLKTAQEKEVSLRIVETTVRANDLRKRAMGDRIIEALGGSAQGKRVALLGLTFKPNTDDMRDAPSLSIVQILLDAGAHIAAFDPEGMERAAVLMPEVEMKNSAYATAKDSDALVIITEWDMFRALDLARIGALMKNRLLVDLRNIYQHEEAVRHGFRHIAIGQRYDD